MTAMNTRSTRIAARASCVAVAVGVIAGPALAQESGDGSSFSLEASYTGDLRRNTTGGLDAGTAYADSVDLGMVWVSDGLFGNSRMTTSLSVMHLGGGDITGEYIGDLQGVNNLEAGNGWKLYESWVEFSFGESSHTLRAGVLDLNAEFDTPVTQGLFTASPFGIGTEFSQTGARGPGVWPTTGLGLRAAGEFNENLHWRVGAYDGAPGTDRDAFTSTRLSGDEGALLVGELEFTSGRIHKLAFGAWGYTADFERIDGDAMAAAEQGGNQGFYAHLDTRLGSIGPVNFDGALRAGTADARFNAVDGYVGLAFTASHLVAARPGDTLGFGVAWANLGAHYRARRELEGPPSSAAETTFELAYRAELTPWLALLPTVQFVRDPGADTQADDAWVAGLRFELAREQSWPLNAHRNSAPDDAYARTN